MFLAIAPNRMGHSRAAEWSDGLSIRYVAYVSRTMRLTIFAAAGTERDPQAHPAHPEAFRGAHHLPEGERPRDKGPEDHEAVRVEEEQGAPAQLLRGVRKAQERGTALAEEEGRRDDEEQREEPEPPGAERREGAAIRERRNKDEHAPGREAYADIGREKRDPETDGREYERDLFHSRRR